MLRKRDNELNSDIQGSMFVNSDVVKKEVDCVFSIMTTPSLKKERRYLLSSRINLLDYEDLEVVYSVNCRNVEDLEMVKVLLFSRLQEYMILGNKDMFKLPSGMGVELFKKELDRCYNFVSCMICIE